MLRPVAFFHAANTSGFNGSPALTQWRSAGNLSQEEASATIRRNAVGGAHHVVIGYCASVCNADCASNFPRESTAKTHAPICHGQKRHDHEAFAQPASVMNQGTSVGFRA